LGKKQGVLGLLLLSVLLLSISFPGIQPASAAGLQPNTLGVVNITTTLTPEYTVFNPSISESVNANFSLPSLDLTSGASVTLSSAQDFNFHTITATAVLKNGTVVSLAVSLIKQTAGDVATIILPNSTTSMIAFVTGDDSGESFLGRFVATVPFIQFSGAGVFPTYNEYLVIPSSSKIAVAYNGLGNQVPLQILHSSKNGSKTTLQISDSLGTLIVESKYFFPVSLALSVFGALAILLVALGLLKKLPSGNALSRFPGLGLLRWGKDAIGRVRAIVSRALTLLFAGRSDPRSPMQTRRQSLLVVFVLLGVLMVSLGALSGPSPAVKAYVIASPTQTGLIQSQLQSMFPNVQVITPAQDYSDFNVMSDVGTFNLIVVSDYPSTAVPEISKFILPSLGNVPVLVVDKLADPTFAAQLEALGPDQTFVVANAAQLNESTTQTLASTVNADRSGNIVGLQISSRGFEEILALEGLLSLILILVGWAYLGSLVSQVITGLTLSRLAAFIASGIFVFYFSEIVYVVTSATLALPVSLHAVISGSSSITATGEMGVIFHLPLGGGSTPRLAAGIFGVLFGAISTTESKVFNRNSLILISGVALVLLVNPFTFGQYTFEGLLLFLGNITFGTAYAGSLTFKGILYGFGSALGGDASPVYVLSAGKILYFAGIVPLALVGRMGRITASVTLLLAALFLGDGGVRVGEMTPDKTVIAVMPGLMVGVAFGLLLLSLSSLEKWLVKNYVRAQP
jgi:hypothetical protein